MADEKLQNSSQRLKNAVDEQQQQQQHLKSPIKMSTTNNSGQVEYIRDDVRKIFIGGLTRETTERDLSEHFGQFGEIEFINVKINVVTGKSRGFAFIVFKTSKGLDNALECTNHVINNKKVDIKKAIPRKVKLFVGGLSPDLTDDEIKDYFQRYAPIVVAEMPYDKVKKQRKGFCFLIFDSIQAVNEIIKLPRHVIQGKQVDVKLAKWTKESRMSFHSFRPMRGMRGHFRGVQGRGGFPPHSGYDPGYCYSGYYYNNQYMENSPDYSYTYGYPGRDDGVRAHMQYKGYKPSAPRGGHRNQIAN